jgi:stage II sporulation protein M
MTNIIHDWNQRLNLAPLRLYGIVSICLFAFGAIAGGLAIVLVPDTAVRLQEMLQQFVQIFRGLPKPKLATAIFLNNSLKTLLVIISGPVLGIVPILFLFINGAILGAVVPLAVQSKGLWSALLTILPHGIFELAAIFLGTSIGLRLGSLSLRRLFGTGNTTLLSEVGYGLRLFITIIVPLLLIAALIEAFVTPLVAGV